jgi:hypothetical protein
MIWPPASDPGVHTCWLRVTVMAYDRQLHGVLAVVDPVLTRVADRRHRPGVA